MKNFNISDILKPNLNYSVHSLLCQYWNSQSFSYLDTPRPNSAILFVTCGKIEFASENEVLTADCGDMIFLPEGSYYQANVRQEFGKTVDYLINFNVPLPDDLALIPHKIQHISHTEYVDMFDRLVQLGLHNPSDSFCIKSHFYALLDRITGDCRADHSPQADLIGNAQKMLSDNSLNVSDIARECGISVSGLRNLFVKSTGIPPIQYRTNIRISRAKFLLESTDMSVYTIAETLGFYDEAHFCRIFKKYTGCSPKKYVESKRL